MLVNGVAPLTMSAASTAPRHILYDVPVSNNGARCRIILYKKGIPQSEVSIASPMDIGGLKSDEYKAINPEQKMPALVCIGEDGPERNLFESDTIARYLMSKYLSYGPSFQPDNPKSNLIARIHDMYMTTIQSCMYRPPPFGPFSTRKDALKEYQKQLNVINDLIADERDGLYLCGKEVSLADATLFPSCVFANYMLPKFEDIETPLPSKIEKWFNDVKTNDPSFAKVNDEIMGGLQSWEDNKRWDTILGAGWRHSDPETLFDKIVNGDIPVAIVKEDDKVLAFKDINPAGPAHVLVIPKDRNGLTCLSRATNEHAEILGRLLVAASEIAKDESLGYNEGARIVINDGPDGGQEIPYLHVHVIGGRQMLWPPG